MVAIWSLLTAQNRSRTSSTVSLAGGAALGIDGSSDGASRSECSCSDMIGRNGAASDPYMYSIEAEVGTQFVRTAGGRSVGISAPESGATRPAAMAAAAVRVWTPSLARIWATWFSTVRTLM